MIKKILVLGVGRSATCLIGYLNEIANKYDLSITIADQNLVMAQTKAEPLNKVEAISFTIDDEVSLSAEIAKHDVIISMLPPAMHARIAFQCLHHQKHMVTASYASDDIRALDQQAKEKDILILMEAGLDPGLDHMSAMKELDDIKAKGGRITSFKSYTGGVIAPESDNNPWNYKITWNPKNVVLAGYGGARFIRDGKYKYIPYHSIFSRLDKVTIPGYGDYDAYTNRDSLHYRKLYKIEEVPTLLRGTLRKTGFCQAWDILVRLGLTNNDFFLKQMKGISYREFINAFLPYSDSLSVEEKIARFSGYPLDHEIIQKMEWLGLFGKENIEIEQGSPAQILQSLLENKWRLNPDDRDMIVMQHQIQYELEDKACNKTVSMIVKGDNSMDTSMAKTVGYPVSKAVELLVTNKLKLKGVHVPIIPQLYEPILDTIHSIGVNFICDE